MGVVLLDLTVKAEKVIVALARVAVGLEIDSLTTIKDRESAGVSTDPPEIIVLEVVIHELDQHFVVVGDNSRQLVVVDGQLGQTTVPHIDIGIREGPTKKVVIEVQVPEHDKLFPQIYREGSTQPVVAQVQLEELPPSKAFRDHTCQLIVRQVDRT